MRLALAERLMLDDWVVGHCEREKYVRNIINQQSISSALFGTWGGWRNRCCDALDAACTEESFEALGVLTCPEKK